MDLLRARRITRRPASSQLVVVVVVCVAALLAASTPASGRPSARLRPARHISNPAERRARAPRVQAPRDKAPKVAPSRPLPFDTTNPVVKATTAAGAAAPMARAAATPLAAAAAVADSTPPTGPAHVTATTQSTVSISAQWDAAQDPESGISSYAFGIGTNPTGTYGSLPNVRYWQAVHGTSVSVSLALDPSLTYYVSVYAANGAGLIGPIVTSPGVHPVAQVLGQAGNVLQIRFAPTGLDENGNQVAGFTSTQTTLMTTFFNRMYPLLAQLYGPPAISHTVTIVRDLHYHNSNIYIPSLDEIHMDDGFYPQLFTHEVLHAFRDIFLLSSDANWNFDATLSGFEESFAQGASYDAMNAYVAAYPGDTIVPSNTLWGSSNDWDYDFQNTAQLRGTDFWSDGGGTGLYWLRYEMGAAAVRKIQIEAPGFYARFNQEYYRRINASPMTVRPTRALVVDIIKTVVPTIEGTPADQWVDAQNIFYARNVYGKKIFNKIQDYPSTNFFVFQNIYFLDTMACGSEWACWDGTKWVYYDLNGSQGSGRLSDNSGNTVWSGPLSIQPAQNPSDGYMGIGSAEKDLTTATSLLPWPGGDPNNYVMNLASFGLYRFDSTFADGTTNTSNTSNSIYRVMGTPMTQSFNGVYGGVVGHKNGTIYIDHEGYATQAGIPVVQGAFAGTRSWTGTPNARTGGHDSVPGRVFITFVDSDTGATYHAQRNIDYGSATGSQMFLFDFPNTAPTDGTAPTVSITAPTSGATVSGSVPITANAADNIAVARVDFTVDGTLVGSDTTAPYAAAWNSQGATAGSHTITAKAFDTSGNSASAPTVTVSIADVAPPSVAITAPVAGARVNGSVAITANAADNVGVIRVDFLIDGKVVSSDTTAPYAMAWNADAATLANHTIAAKAYDARNNATTSTGVVVKVVDATVPTVAITGPTNGSTVSRSTTVTIAATASDNRGVARVEFAVNNSQKCSDTSNPYSCRWSVPSARNVVYTLRVRAFDAAGNFAEKTITVTSR